MGLQALIYFSMIAWLPSVLSGKCADPGMPGMLMLWLQALSIVTGFLAPILTQRPALRKAISLAAGGFYCLGLSLILVSHALPLLFLGAGICGLASGTSFSYALTLISLNGSTREETTWLSGFAQMAGYALASIGPLLLGAAFDLSGSWSIPMLILILFSGLMSGVGMQVSK